MISIHIHSLNFVPQKIGIRVINSHPTPHNAIIFPNKLYASVPLSCASNASTAALLAVTETFFPNKSDTFLIVLSSNINIHYLQFFFKISSTLVIIFV